MGVRTELVTRHRHPGCVKWMSCLKLGTAWKVEPPNGRIVTGTFVLQGLGMPSEQFLDRVLSHGWNGIGCIGKLCHLLRSKVLADPLQLSVLYFLEVYLCFYFPLSTRLKMQSLGIEDHTVLQEMSVGSVQRKEEGDAYIDG